MAQLTNSPVIPAKAGTNLWPALLTQLRGMTGELVSWATDWVPAFGGMTGELVRLATDWFPPSRE